MNIEVSVSSFHANQLCNLLSCSINQAPNTNHNRWVWLIQGYNLSRWDHQKLTILKLQNVPLKGEQKKMGWTQMGFLIGHFLRRVIERERDEGKTRGTGRGQGTFLKSSCVLWQLAAADNHKNHWSTWGLGSARLEFHSNMTLYPARV